MDKGADMVFIRSLVCMASSRVGLKINTFALLAAGLLSCAIKSGITKASVFPEPVGAMARILSPLAIAGISFS